MCWILYWAGLETGLKVSWAGRLTGLVNEIGWSLDWAGAMAGLSWRLCWPGSRTRLEPGLG
jgi:hypothetical protein